MAPSTIPVTWMVVSCHATAITCTVARLLYRWHTRRFWWEDIWAMIAAAWAVICVAGFLLYDMSMNHLSPRNQISAWFMALSFTAVLWAVRLSIFLSLIRVSNPTSSLRHIALACIASFLIMFVASMAQKIYYCVAENCFISTTIGIMQLITDVLSDTLLVLGPIPLLRDVHLSKNRRILILSAFWSSILVTAISITHSVLLMHDADLVTVILAAMKAAVSLFICNILVLVTFVYRVCRRQGNREGIDLDALFPETGPLYLTSIDLGVFTASTGTVGGCESNANAGPGQDPVALECLSVHGQSELSSSNVRSDAGSADKCQTSDKMIDADAPR